jgi:hypothetical protein
MTSGKKPEKINTAYAPSYASINYKKTHNICFHNKRMVFVDGK